MERRIFQKRYCLQGNLVMRIISGKFKNRKIYSPTDNITRPLKDMVRESIFNIIEHSKLLETKISNSSVLDLYSGSGSFGLECLSRGALKVDFCEDYLPAFKILKKNVEYLECIGRVGLFNENVFKFLKHSNDNKSKYDIIFLDPPYKESKIEELFNLVSVKKILKKKTLFILHRNKKTKDRFPNNFNIIFNRTYGLSKIYFGKF